MTKACLIVALLISIHCFAQQELQPFTAKLPNGVELHYIAEGNGIPILFIHGALSNYAYWRGEVNSFGKHYHALAYSRRYNVPNHNAARPHYSAMEDAEDVAALIQLQALGKAHIVGHSYGALVALCLAIRHPELVRSLVLSEATAVSLLKHSRGANRERCDSTWKDIQERMVSPMKKAFQRHEAEMGAEIFVNYVLDDSLAWDRFPSSIKADLLAGTQEWDVMMNGGILFPDVTPEQVSRIKAPVLMLSGAHSYPFLGLIDQELRRLLSNNKHVVIKNAGHRMWTDQPEECRNLTLQFIGQH